ncbi:MAG: hypothetical protein KKE11_02275, partial [Gammaproteobacteria bacterium]|nr:hypothetical protein [Gammaproteobacteria bacterium]
MNVKYILLHNDANWEFIEDNSWYISPPSKFSELALYKSGEIHFIKSFGKLDFYKISDEYFLPHIYPSTTSTMVASDIKALMPMTKTRYLGGKPALLFSEQRTENREQITEKTLKNINNFVFKDSNWQDLVTELAVQSTVKGSQSTVRIKKAGVYEIYFDVSEMQ